MFFRFYHYVCIVIFFSFFSVNTYSMSVNEIKTFLHRAVNYSIKTPFSSVYADYISGIKFRDIKFYSNGKKVRVEYPATNQMWPHVIISETPWTNREYAWVETRFGSVKNNAVIYRHYPTDYNFWPIVYAMLEKSRLNAGKYRISEGRHESISCWRIIVTYPSNSYAILQAPLWHFDLHVGYRVSPPASEELWNRKLTSKELLDNQNMIMENYFAKIELLVDKNPQKPFIYSCNVYNMKGKLITEYSWGKVNFKVLADEKKFLPPSGVKILVAANKDQGGDFYIDNYGTGSLTDADIFWMKVKDNLSKIGQNILAFFTAIGLWLLENGGWLFSVIAIILVILIFVLKNKFR